MKSFLIIILSLFTNTFISAQNELDRAYIIERTNVEALNEIADRQRTNYEEQRAKALETGVPLTITLRNNQTAFLAGFDDKGNPIYDHDDNLDVAKASRLDKIWEGGSSGLELNGDGIEIGHWEAGGLPRLTHSEFGGRVSHGENEDVTNHGTHTAGTMVAAGLNSAARGGASSSTLVSRRSGGDEAEIAEFGAAGGIISNHSYSTGNPNGNVFEYGKYTLNSKEWDEILFNAPYLTLCKSAANDRNDGVNPIDNGYDILFTVALCKNLLTIGAVLDVNNYTGPESVIMTDFSSWGPTDDWRVKPDIVANGQGVFSSGMDSNNDYSQLSGTSMSTPSVTGVVSLLQQHYHNENGVYMKAATVKSLLINTADEAGEHPGPDFQNGWGLINAERAAETISNNGVTSLIIEESLDTGDSITISVTSEGNQPLNVSIAWTDPAYGSEPAVIDNTRILLINDLDVRVKKEDSTFEPWMFTPNDDANNFTDPAQKGDNIRDNVEFVQVENAEAGEYEITISHKENLLNGFQDFSIVINGISAYDYISRTDNFKIHNTDLSLFPNPNKEGLLKIDLSTDIKYSEYNVELFDMQGRLLKNATFNNKQSEMDIANLESGVYLLKLKVGEVEIQKLLVIQD